MLRRSGGYLVREPLPRICKAVNPIHSTAPQHTLSKRKRELVFYPLLTTYYILMYLSALVHL